MVFCIFKCSQSLIDDKNGVLLPCCLGDYLQHLNKYENKHFLFGKSKSTEIEDFLWGMRWSNSMETFKKLPCIMSVTCHRNIFWNDFILKTAYIIVPSCLFLHSWTYKVDFSFKEYLRTWYKIKSAFDLWVFLNFTSNIERKSTPKTKKYKNRQVTFHFFYSFKLFKSLKGTWILDWQGCDETSAVLDCRKHHTLAKIFGKQFTIWPLKILPELWTSLRWLSSEIREDKKEQQQEAEP